MPKTTQRRTVNTELALARRIAYERQLRGWSYEGLAVRMAQVGCPIDQSAVYKIEKHDPPRRITVDELVGFGAAFGVPIQELLLPPHVVAQAAVSAALDRVNEATMVFEHAKADLETAKETARAALGELGLELGETESGIVGGCAWVVGDWHTVTPEMVDPPAKPPRKRGARRS